MIIMCYSIAATFFKMNVADAYWCIDCLLVDDLVLVVYVTLHFTVLVSLLLGAICFSPLFSLPLLLN